MQLLPQGPTVLLDEQIVPISDLPFQVENDFVIVRPDSHKVNVKLHSTQMEFLINSVGHTSCINGCPHIDINVYLNHNNKWTSAHGASIKTDLEEDVHSPSQHEDNHVDDDSEAIHGILGQTVHYRFDAKRIRLTLNI